jgi:diguanylate cyclase
VTGGGELRGKATPSVGGTDVPLDALGDFRSACTTVLDYLRSRVGLDLWMVTRAAGDRWIVLEATENDYGIAAGHVWHDSLCARMVEGAPRVAPRVAEVPAYRDAPVRDELPIAAYVAVPLPDADGALFGTLCAIDPVPQPDDLLERAATVELLGELLGTILRSELAREADRRRLEIAEADALTDVLTALPNRRAWERFIAQEEARCARYGHQAAVLMIDVDGLKALNDTEGHAAGDALLRRCGRLLLDVSRDSDLAARLGGDEFGLVATEVDGDAAADLRTRIEHDLREIGVRASVGLAVRRPDGTLEVAMEEADGDMYRRKNGSRG